MRLTSISSNKQISVMVSNNLFWMTFAVIRSIISQLKSETDLLGSVLWK